MKKRFLITILLILTTFMTGGLNLMLQPTAAASQASLTAVGDVMLGRNVGDDISSEGTDYPFRLLGSRLAASDITFGNLESPLSDEGKALSGKSVVFRGDPAMAPVLQQQGFDVMSMANNHAMDYNTPALIETISLLNQNSVQPVGAGANLLAARKAVIITRNGLRVGFLAYTDVDYYSSFFRTIYFTATGNSYGVAPMDKAMIMQDIAALEPLVDVTVVSLHWGKEYSSSPTSAQEQLAHAIIDGGAELIIGHHPHRLQGVERYKNGLIAYSLGNFVFDQYSRTYMRQSMILDVTLAPQQVVAASVTPVLITNSQPAILTGTKATSLLKTIAGYCDDLNTTTAVQNGKMTINMN